MTIILVSLEQHGRTPKGADPGWSGTLFLC